MDKRLFKLTSNDVRQRAIDAIWGAPDGYTVIVQETIRSLSQSAKLHAICGELERLKIKWNGKTHTKEVWKLLLISGHAIATGMQAELIEGLEGEMVNIRESTAIMGKGRTSSLIEYSTALLETLRP